MKFELKAISLWPFIKVSVILNTAIGFILGIIYALFLGFFLSIASSMSGPLAEEFSGEDLPLGLLIIILPIAFALIGGILYTIFGVILVTLYNLAASLAGGLEFEFAQVGQFAPANQPPQTQSYYASSYPGYSPPTSSGAVPPPPPPPQQPPTNPPPQSFE
jgi:hypothetical protein